MQKARIRTGWKNRNKQITIEEFSNALSSICWRMSLNAAKNLHAQDFVYSSDDQRLGVIREYLVFLMHCADRLMIETLDADKRQRFMQSLAADCQRHFRENAREIAPGKQHESSWVEFANQRMDAYAGTGFAERQPGYDMLRLLGASVLEIMGNDQTNKWVIDQVMDIDGPESYEVFVKSMDKLRRNAGFSE